MLVKAQVSRPLPPTLEGMNQLILSIRQLWKTLILYIWEIFFIPVLVFLPYS